MTTTCPSCSGAHVLSVAEHYAAQVRQTGADPAAMAPFAPPLSRSLWSGTLCIFLFFMAVLSPGFAESEWALTVSTCFAIPGAATLVLWLRTRKTDRRRMDAYLRGRYCPDCGHRFTLR